NLGFGEELFLYVGGSASSPLTIKTGQSLIFDNPYTRKSVTFIPQIKITSKSDGVERWIDVTWTFENNYGRGISVVVTSDGKIGIYVGYHLIMNNAQISSGIAAQLLPNTAIAEASFRLRVI
ncbi:hypothetical protein, partial [Pectobacterium sp. B1J-3]|uniref:hypothetical protein n=1 Tax=Pectobacterium sp. B1J-3 TaxID=3385371 RepID=UPI0039069A2D